MKRLFLGAAALCLFASSALAGNGLAYHTAVKIQATGINMNAGTGVTAGYVAGTVDRAPVVDKDGKAIGSGGVCGGGGGVSTFTNLNSKASATAGNVPTMAGGTVSNLTNPSLALATGDVTGNAAAAAIAAASMTEHPADVLAALCGNSNLPSAPAGSIVRDGILPAAQ